MMLTCPACLATVRGKPGSSGPCPSCGRLLRMPADQGPTTLDPSGVPTTLYVDEQQDGVESPEEVAPARPRPQPRPLLTPIPLEEPRRGVPVAAVLLFVFAGLLAGGGIVWLALASKEKGSGRAGWSSKEGSLVERVRTHKFWRKKQTAADVERLVSTIGRQKQGCMVWIDDAGHIGVWESSPVTHQYRKIIRQGVIPTDALPDGIGPRRFYIDMMDFDREPTRQEVLEMLLEKLDAAAFRA